MRFGALVCLFLILDAPLASAHPDGAPPVATQPGVAEAESHQSEDEGPWRNELFRLDLGGIMTWYTSAVEMGTDGDSNDQLANDFSFGLFASASWRFWGPFSVGLYVQFEAGNRKYGTFTGDVVDGVAIVDRQGGGGFSETWFGPLVRAQWESLFLEIGWGPLGFRSDDGRVDLPAGGEASGAFQSTPSTAWLIGIGAAVPLLWDLELVMRINYRIRYYESRGGEDLDGGLAHGTQDIIPFVGLGWAFDRTLLD